VIPPMSFRACGILVQLAEPGHMMLFGPWVPRLWERQKTGQIFGTIEARMPCPSHNHSAYTIPSTSITTGMSTIDHSSPPLPQGPKDTELINGGRTMFAPLW